MINPFKKVFSSKKNEESNIIKEETSYTPNLNKEELFSRDTNFFDRDFKRSYDENSEINHIKYQIQILNSKIDAISAKLDNLIMRLSYLENLINSLFYRR